MKEGSDGENEEGPGDPNNPAVTLNEPLGTRDVVVPLSLYKIITVFSTLIAGSFVVGGFMILDTATRRASVPASEIDPVLAILGLGLIGLGALVYAFSGRFRAQGMGTTKPEDDEGQSNG